MFSSLLFPNEYPSPKQVKPKHITARKSLIVSIIRTPFHQISALRIYMYVNRSLYSPDEGLTAYLPIGSADLYYNTLQKLSQPIFYIFTNYLLSVKIHPFLNSFISLGVYLICSLTADAGLSAFIFSTSSRIEALTGTVIIV